MSHPLFSLSGGLYVVTGGTRGIGRAVSFRLAREGATVIANYVRGHAAAEALANAARDESLAISLCRADLTLPKGIEALTKAATAASDRLRGLVYCAATGVHKPYEELTLRHYDWTFALNIRAFFELVKRLLPHFSPGASIVAISSPGAVRTVPGYAAIGASKGALDALARHLAVELAPRGIRVNIVSPGAVATEAWGAIPDAEARLTQLADRTPLGRLVSADEVALAVLYLCSEAGRAIVGHTLVVDGGASLPL